MQSCSPFGNSSLITTIGSSIADFFDSKATTIDFGPGGSQAVVTSDNYKVTYSFGASAQSPLTQTNDGYTILSNVKTKTTTE